MQQTDNAGRGRETLIITRANLFDALQSGNLRIPSSDCREFEFFHTGLVSMISAALPHTTIRTIDVLKLTRRLGDKVSEIVARDPNKVVVSICADIASFIEGPVLSMHVNRLFDTDGTFLAHGARPGFDSIDAQIDALKPLIGDRPIVMVEDGAITGRTLRYMMNKFEMRGHTVSNIVIGFCKLDAEGALKAGLNGRLSVVEEMGALRDWLAQRDYALFAPRCGRIIGERTLGGFMPFRTAEGWTCSIPYVRPYGDLAGWASLPESCVVDLSRFCLHASIKLFECMQRLNGRPILIEDLVRCPWVSMPVEIGRKEKLPSPKMEVLGYVRDALTRLG